MPAAGLIAGGIVLWRSRRAGRRFPLGPALLALGVYHVLFLAEGNVYSFSAIRGPESLLVGAAWRTLAGLGAGWLWLALRRRRGEGQAARAAAAEEALGYGWLVVGLLSGLLALLAWLIGPVVGWAIPNMTLLFLILMTLVQTLFAAAGAVLLAGVAALVNL